MHAGFLQTDHRVDWAESHITMFDLLDRLCPHHHRMKTNQGWALAGGRGKRPFVAPDDPRHPRSAGPPVRTRPAPSNGPRTAPSNGPRTAPSNGPRTAPSTAPSTAPGTAAPGPVAASGDAAVRGPSPPGPAAPRAHTSPQALPPPEATAPRPAPATMRQSQHNHEPPGRPRSEPTRAYRHRRRLIAAAHAAARQPKLSHRLTGPATTPADAPAPGVAAGGWKAAGRRLEGGWKAAGRRPQAVPPAASWNARPRRASPTGSQPRRGAAAERAAR